jgi:hypothetical protein
MLMKTKRMTGRRLKVGDVFTIPVVDGRVALGQVVFRRLDGLEIFICVFDRLFSTDEQMTELKVEGLTPCLLGYVTDSGFYHDRWQVVSNQPTDTGLAPPCYVVDTTQGTVVKRPTGEVVRPASREDALFYPKKMTLTSALFEIQIAHVLGVAHASYVVSGIDAAYVKQRMC